MRKTVGVSVFPVGFSGGLKLEGPLCVNGTASKWHAGWDPNRSEIHILIPDLAQQFVARMLKIYELRNSANTVGAGC